MSRFDFSFAGGRAFAVALVWAVLPAAGQVPLNTVPSRVVGHARTLLVNRQPNLVEGRELNSPSAAAADTINNILWVSDTGNNRVLGWKNFEAFENGAMADLVVGQRDLLSTDSLGPGTSFTSGLFAPTGLAVDARGNLYVADSGNNRIVRFPNPGSQTPGEPVLADMVIGQANFNTRAVNAGGVSERTLFTAIPDVGILFVGMAFDAAGNLWVSDSGNNRVLRYASTSLGQSAANQPAATLVLGQQDFRTNTSLPEDIDARTRTRKEAMRQPAGLAFDQAGRLFVTDGLNRALVFRPPFTIGMDAARIMGFRQPVAGQPPPAPVNDQTVGAFVGFRFLPANGVFTIGNVPFVVDTPVSRILRYAPFDQWPAEATQYSPAATAIIAQDTLTQTELRANRGLPEPSAATMNNPVAAVFANGQTYVVDAGNNRVLALGDISTGPLLSAGPPYAAQRVLGQLALEYRSPNLIEGRELNSPRGVAIDSSSTPPRLYIADFGNNRVLGYADARRVRPGDRADIVIGQPDFFRSLVNFPSNNSDIRDDASLNGPSGLATDSSGGLWVADTLNGRVLRFPSPFEQRGVIKADVVLGQLNFGSRNTDPTSRTMSAPWGLALSSQGQLFVSDAAHNRVLMFEAPFQNGKASSRVFGQPDFSSIGSGTVNNRFNSPRGIAVDTDDRLYVTDFGNNRVLLFARAPLAGNDPQASFTIAREVTQPLAVYVSPVTGEIWVTGQSPAGLRFPNFNVLLISGDQPDFRMPVGGGLAVAQDQFGALYLADFNNRVAIHFPGLRVVNATNFLPRVAPGMISTMQVLTQGQIFSEDSANAEPTAWPRELADLQVLVDDRPAPIQSITPTQINFQMPNSAPGSGTVDVLLFRPSQGRIIASQQIRMDVASPGLFTVNGSGNGAVVALNEDGAANTRQTPVPRGKVITLTGTGQGFIPDAPPDGTAAGGEVMTPFLPRVFAGGTTFVPDANIVYSGLAPGQVGVWQIKVKIPDTVPPGETVVVVVANDTPSNDGGRLRHTIFVSQ